jgi:hypothetical protein
VLLKMGDSDARNMQSSCQIKYTLLFVHLVGIYILEYRNLIFEEEMNSFNKRQLHFTIEDKAHFEMFLLKYVQRRESGTKQTAVGH